MESFGLYSRGGASSNKTITKKLNHIVKYRHLATCCCKLLAQARFYERAVIGVTTDGSQPTWHTIRDMASIAGYVTSKGPAGFKAVCKVCNWLVSS